MMLKNLAYQIITCRPSVLLSDLIARGVFSGKIPNRGCRIDTNTPAINAWVRTLILWDLHETAELRMIERYLPADLDVIELGGSIGVVASQIARRMAPDRRLVSVEANPELIELLRRNIETNGPRVRATSVHGAIAYDVSPTDQVGFRFGSSSLGARRPQPGKQPAQCWVPVVRLADLLAREEIDRFALVTDIEGAEVDIFLHEQDSLKRCQLMISELHETVHDGRRYSIKDLLDLASRLGFREKDRHRDVYVLVNEVLEKP